MKQVLLIFLLIAVSFGAGFFVYKQNDYDFETLNSESFKYAQFSGDYVVVNYFAEWCAPCLKEVPELNQFAQKKPQNAHLFAISYDNLTSSQLKALKQKYNMQFPLVSTIKKPFPFEKPAYLPATYVIFPDGTVKGPLLGEQTSQSLLSIVTN